MSSPSVLEPVAHILRTNAAACDDDASFPTESFTALRKHGLLGFLVPTEHGGVGAELEEFVEMARWLGSHCLSTAQIWAMHCFQVDAIVRFGSQELKDDLLSRIAAGDVYIASVTSERGRASGLFTALAPLTETSEGLLVERSAPVVTGGEHADGYLITMRASPEASEGEVTFVYADRADVDVRTESGWNALGMRGTASVALQIDGTVPRHNVVGLPGKFDHIARESMIPVSHLGWAACWLGAAQGALEELVRWFSRSRKPGPTPSRGAGSELFHERLGGIRIKLELVSAYLRQVCQEVTAARDLGASLAAPGTQIHLNTLKVAASELTFEAVNAMVELAGLRLGYLRDAPIPLERHFRDLRAASMNHANSDLRVGIGALSMLDRRSGLI
ncbi:acyl-CoA dehydrogenase family protein [Streptomyces sp. NPDC127098]|uniref:acyl-CoA dehydrogenase family protein n=1 Tax=Streptomyces sp. NPDC127098 TaxID=3347137 RepID=UPI00364B55A3